MLTGGASTASWLSALDPAFIALPALAFLRERIISWQRIGVVLALKGTLLVSEADPSSLFEGGGWSLNAFLIASALARVIYQSLEKTSRHALPA
jgi:drug/metabolite transporter (DMT)-like permease